MTHGDLTPRNLRITSDGSVWLFDWEYARWGPPLADELRFWVTNAALRRRLRPHLDGRRIASALLESGDPRAIAEALAWRDYVTPKESAVRAAIAREVLKRSGEVIEAGGG